MREIKIKITLKNGELVDGLIKTDKPDSEKFLNKLLYNTENELYDFIGFLDMTKTHNIIVRVSEIAVLDISVIK